MLFLIDENLPTLVGQLFKERGFEVEYIADNADLRSQPDEVVFKYALGKDAIVVTRDIGFASIVRFQLTQLGGVVLLRFPNEIFVATLCEEIKRLMQNLEKKDFYRHLIVIEPGIVRIREL